MNINDVISELKQQKDLVFLLSANGENGRICGHAPDLATALSVVFSAYHGSDFDCPKGGPLNMHLIQAVQSVVRELKRARVPFVLAWHVRHDTVARLDCSGDIDLQQELIDCMTDELQTAFTF